MPLGSERIPIASKHISPVVGIKDLKLREVPVERRDVLHPSTPECTDFENVAYRACDLHMREWRYQRTGEAHELQQGLGEPMSLVGGTTRLPPGLSKARNVGVGS